MSQCVSTTGGTSTTHYVHTDQLLGSNVITDASGTVEELTDYYPFGTMRLDSKTTSFSEQRKYAGTMHDDSTGLDYMQARYYSGAHGQFISQDPVHLALGDTNLVQQITGKSQQAILADPQQLNSYSYALNNPILKSDPTGNFVPLLVALGYVFLAYSIADTAIATYDSHIMDKYPDQFSAEERRSGHLTVAFDVASLIIGFKAEKGTALILNTAPVALTMIDQLAGQQTYRYVNTTPASQTYSGSQSTFTPASSQRVNSIQQAVNSNPSSNPSGTAYNNATNNRSSTNYASLINQLQQLQQQLTALLKRL